MVIWSIEFKPETEHDLGGLDWIIRRRIIEKLDWFALNFDSLFPISLKGEFKDFSKLRVGDWRVFYQVNWEKHLIIVCYIDRRDKAYKKK
ncbi:MAG: type II toxin-antitoxin system RelE/ParE family toxin [Patescibacteria group bacterium]